MIRDFADAYADFIEPDGEMRVPIAVYLPPPIVMAADPDGLMMTATVCGVNGEACMLSMLFPMSVDSASRLVRQHRPPAKVGDLFLVEKQRDTVIGGSGERYARFTGKVTSS